MTKDEIRKIAAGYLDLHGQEDMVIAFAQDIEAAVIKRQRVKYHQWRQQAHNVVIIEIGAGTAIPTVRMFSEDQSNAFLIRINPTEPGIGWVNGVSLQMSGGEALRGIVKVLEAEGFL